MSLSEHEAQLTEYNGVYEWALRTLSESGLSSETIRAFVQDKTTAGMDCVLLRLTDTKSALHTFIKVCAHDDAGLTRRSGQLLIDIEDIEQRARKMKDFFLKPST